MAWNCVPPWECSVQAFLFQSAAVACMAKRKVGRQQSLLCALSRFCGSALPPPGETFSLQKWPRLVRYGMKHPHSCPNGCTWLLVWQCGVCACQYVRYMCMTVCTPHATHMLCCVRICRDISKGAFSCPLGILFVQLRLLWALCELYKSHFLAGTLCGHVWRGMVVSLHFRV